MPNIVQFVVSEYYVIFIFGGKSFNKSPLEVKLQNQFHQLKELSRLISSDIFHIIDRLKD